MEGEGKHEGETNRDSAIPYEKVRLFKENLPPEGVEREYDLPEPMDDFDSATLDEIRKAMKALLEEANLRDREKVTEYLKERYPDNYEKLVEEYFRALAEE